MEQIMGIGGYNPVKPGRHVSVRCGPPIDFNDLILAVRPSGERGADEEEARLFEAITARIENALHDLELKSLHDIPWESPGGQASDTSRQRLGSWAPASFDKKAAMDAAEAAEARE
jgi:hypothetical protein